MNLWLMAGLLILLAVVAADAVRVPISRWEWGVKLVGSSCVLYGVLAVALADHGQGEGVTDARPDAGLVAATQD